MAKDMTDRNAPDYPRINLVAKNFVYDVVRRCGANMTVNGSAISTMIHEVELMLDSNHYREHLSHYMQNKPELDKLFAEYTGQ